MTMKEMFKKVETYNEVAEMMRTDKASVYFYDTNGSWTSGEHFRTYNDFRKHIRNEYIKEVADLILKADTFEMDSETSFIYKDRFGEETISTFGAELSAN